MPGATQVTVEKDGDIFWATAFDPKSFGYCSANGSSEQEARDGLAKAIAEQLAEGERHALLG